MLCCCYSFAKPCSTLCDPMDCCTPGSSVLHYRLEFAQIHVHWVGDAILPSHPLLPPSSFALSLSQHQGLSKWVSSSYQVTKYWSFSFNISSSNEYSELISFRVQGTLKSLFQDHSSKAWILWCSAFFIVELWWSFIYFVSIFLFHILSFHFI